ncbi:MAG: formylglycine-generating enzyme family protein [Phycisphaerae bacterium]|nr:formylglycine-generating enzyme family protein [Phycisphaerae bacterium]
MRSVAFVLLLAVVGRVGGPLTLFQQASASPAQGGPGGQFMEPADELLNLEDVLFVDDDASHDPGPHDLTKSDPAEDGSQDHPFDSIQEAIEVAHNAMTVLVRQGRYIECLNLRGKALRIIGFDPINDMDRFPIIDANDQGPVVTFNQGEDASCLLSGFVLTRGYGEQAGAVACIGSSPTIRHCLIVGNRCRDSDAGVPDLLGPYRGVVYCVDSHSLFENCTLADNDGGRYGSGICVTNSDIRLSNSILWSHAQEQIRVISGNPPLVLNTSVDMDPMFALPGAWVNRDDPDLAVVEPYDPKAIWLDGDYHLKSLHGHYDAYLGDWVYDDDTSDCIDLGDPAQSVGQETAPHGDRLNVGAYGGTWMASRTGKLVFVPISEPGFFTGEMSKYEITNGQYCQYLGMALAEGLIEVVDNRVYAASDRGHLEPYFRAYPASSTSQIMVSDGAFTVRSRDGYGMANHPVVAVSLYGATAFAEYFGYRLPTSDEWEAVADYDGTYTYGCGEVIDLTRANYDSVNPLGLTSFPYTSPVGYYPAFGYGLCDVAGNVQEWTYSASGRYRLLKSGDWQSIDVFCTVVAKSGFAPSYTLSTIGFRVCR